MKPSLLERQEEVQSAGGLSWRSSFPQDAYKPRRFHPSEPNHPRPGSRPRPNPHPPGPRFPGHRSSTISTPVPSVTSASNRPSPPETRCILLAGMLTNTITPPVGQPARNTPPPAFDAVRKPSLPFETFLKTEDSFSASPPVNILKPSLLKRQAEVQSAGGLSWRSGFPQDATGRVPFTRAKRITPSPARASGRIRIRPGPDFPVTGPQLFLLLSVSRRTC